MSNVRLLRLQADYEAMRRLVRLKPKVKVETVTGNPPERYQLRLTVRSLQENGSQLTYVNEHRVEIRLPLGYPRDAPVCRMLTPIFHPNIAPHTICIGDHWSAGESLDALVMRICEMLAYQSYNVKSPLNGEAAQWVEENLTLLPLDADMYFVETDYTEAQTVSGQRQICSNCETAITREATQCDGDHLLCPDCTIHCETCGRLLCLSCGIIECPQCVTAHRKVCSNCGTSFTSEAAQCDAGHLSCPDCAIYCETCERLLCLSCGTIQCSQCITDPG